MAITRNEKKFFEVVLTVTVVDKEIGHCEKNFFEQKS